MTHLLALLSCLLGFAALALATDRQQRDLFGGPASQLTIHLLRLGGSCGLIVAAAILFGTLGWGLGCVAFSGHTSLAAGSVYSALIVYKRHPMRGKSIR